LTISDILAMTEEDLRIECLQLEIPTSGLDKITIQKQLLEHLGIMTSTLVGHRGGATDNPVVSADLAGAGLGYQTPTSLKLCTRQFMRNIQSTSQMTNRSHTTRIRVRE